MSRPNRRGVGVNLSSLLNVKFVHFHVPNDLVNRFFNWEEQMRENHSFDSGGGGFGSGQLLRDWQLDFMTPVKRKILLQELESEIKRHKWSVAVLGKQAEVYVNQKKSWYVIR